MNELAIIRVFPRRTSYTPSDDLAFVGDPPLYQPAANEVHISVTFTWDIPEARRLQRAWAEHYPIVRLGGPAIDGEGDDFIPGCYVKPGVTFTTRGCIRSCPWCLVKDKPFRELEPFAFGHIINDNNVLAASRLHFGGVCIMLNQLPKGACFRGGLDARLLTPWHVGVLQQLRSIGELWLACDTDKQLPPLGRAMAMLAWLPRRKKRVYVLCGYNNQTPDEAEHRLQAVWELGALPFAQLYRGLDGHHRKTLSSQWAGLIREWSRPAAMMAMHKSTEAEGDGG